MAGDERRPVAEAGEVGREIVDEALGPAADLGPEPRVEQRDAQPVHSTSVR
jgi:hypothetical protein